MHKYKVVISIEIHNFQARIGLNTTEFDQGMQRAKDHVRSFGDEFGKAIAEGTAAAETSLSGMGSVFTDAIDFMSRFKDATDKVVLVLKALDTAEKVSKNIKTLTDALSKGVSKGIDFKGGLEGAAASAGKAKTAKGLLTGAQLKLNAAMKANKIGLIVAGIAVLGTAISGIIRWFNRETEAAREVRLENERLIEGVDRLTEAAQRSADSHEQKVMRMENEVNASRNLLERISELNSNEDKTVEQRAKMANYVQILNDSMEGLNLQYDMETGLLNKTVDAIKMQIDAREGQMRAQIAQERQIELLREQMEMERKQAELRERITELYEKGAYTEIRERGLVIASVHEHQSAIDELEEAYNELTDVLYDNAGQSEYWRDVVVRSVMDAESGVKSYADIAEYEMARAAKAAEVMAQAQETALKSLAREYESVRNAARQMFSAMSNETEMTLGEVEGNLRNNIDVTQQWGLDVARLGEAAGEGLYQGFVDYLSELGIDSADKIRMFVNGLDYDPEGVHRIAELFRESGEASIEAIANAFGLDKSVVREAADLAQNTGDTLRRELEEAGFPEMGLMVVRGFSDGIAQNRHFAEAASRQMALDVVRAASEPLEIRSPSRVFRYLAEMSVQGFAGGIGRNAAKAVIAVKNMGKKILNASKEIELPAIIDDIEKKYDNSAAAEMLEEKVSLFNDNFSRIVEIVTSKLDDMSHKSQEIIWRMMSKIDTFLRREGFNTGINFFRALGEGLISEQANLLQQSLFTANLIRAAFDARPASFAGSFVTTAAFSGALQSRSFGAEMQSAPTIKQYFYGVREEKTAYQTQRAAQQALALEGF